MVMVIDLKRTNFANRAFLNNPGKFSRSIPRDLFGNICITLLGNEYTDFHEQLTQFFCRLLHCRHFGGPYIRFTELREFPNQFFIVHGTIIQRVEIV